eukprot:CAMPEP_0182421416 /NCGR_PEP_ID=MMETSP1167-20130531/6801_1 /TAXON_ID=2988 /ORGANISM="Mallomonas Sp, Strain CCMP3275" /LENGTH=132 /DNA_ID=CAMNT_0024598539 /DNA_START=344 /DNA_END=742 /DNA_ORIENTATION=+
MYYTVESNKLQTDIGEASYLIRSRCFDLKKQRIQNDCDIKKNDSIHIIQRELPESEILRNDQDVELGSDQNMTRSEKVRVTKHVGIRRMTLTSTKLNPLSSVKSDPDYGFYDILEFGNCEPSPQKSSKDMSQ